MNNTVMASQKTPSYDGGVSNFLTGGVLDNFNGIDKNALFK